MKSKVEGVFAAYLFRRSNTLSCHGELLQDFIKDCGFKTYLGNPIHALDLVQGWDQTPVRYCNLLAWRSAEAFPYTIFLAHKPQTDWFRSMCYRLAIPLEISLGVLCCLARLIPTSDW